MTATLTFLGTGTSMGVPTLGCTCAVCVDAHRAGSPNRRTRPSILIAYPDAADATITRRVLIDTGQDFHAQAIAHNVRALDAVLYTHGHADHVLGMDDLRPLTFAHADGLPLYADNETAATLERIFDYTFRKENKYPTSARVRLHRIDDAAGTTIDLFGASFVRVPVLHGTQRIAGYRFGSAAYLTDLSDIPEESFALLRDLDILILDALRREPHPSHSHLDNSIALVQRIAPKRAFFTHISHGLEHEATNAELPAHIRLAHDGLMLEFDLAQDAVR